MASEGTLERKKLAGNVLEQELSLISSLCGYLSQELLLIFEDFFSAEKLPGRKKKKKKDYSQWPSCGDAF